LEGGWRERAVLMSALVLEKEGLDFYSKISRVAADPRARQLFQEMAEQRLEEMRLLNERYGELTGEEAAPTPEEAERRLAERGEPVPSVYPRKSTETAVCFVCGEEVPVDSLPDECPNCGASRYAFERDIDEEAAFRMVRENEERRLEFYRVSMDHALGGVRGLLEDLIQRGEEYLKELRDKRP
jgi:rubrerythrin